MCNLGEILELEAIKSERVRNIKSIMTKLKMSFKEAIAFLEIPEDEVLELELEDVFNNDLNKGDNAKHCPRFLIKEFLIFSRRNFKEDNKNKTHYNNN